MTTHLAVELISKLFLFKRKKSHLKDFYFYLGVQVMSHSQSEINRKDK